MKNVLLLSICFFAILSCTSKKEKERIRMETVRDSTKKAQAWKDSVAIADQDRAIGNIYFGISPKVFDKKLEEFKESTKTPYSTSLDGTVIMYNNRIGDFKFIVVTPEFYQDSLWSVEINGYNYNRYEYVYETKSQKESLVKELTKKYGKPEYDFPVRNDYTTEGHYLIAGWNVGKKRVTILSAYFKDKYNLVLQIFNMEVNARLRDEEYQKMKDGEKNLKSASDLL
ncbi:hypothetical protein [Emticicia fluvialis]|uniref:hypothetical protein n=1 Tax=Emticicia fluvialis TaxID=2974474 RepID=UPI0021662E3F|nr:hypothetical protein [Emticicia fluvialis]